MLVPEAPSAAQTLPDLTGKTEVEAMKMLADNGFSEVPPRGTYRQWEHPDDSIVLIAPNGRVVRTGPKIVMPGKKAYRRRYNQNGEVIPFQPGGENTHETGELIVP